MRTGYRKWRKTGVRRFTPNRCNAIQLTVVKEKKWIENILKNSTI